jgi:hypothetical protein
MKHKRLTAGALAVTVGAVGVGTAIATPGTGILGAPILGSPRVSVVTAVGE